MLHRGGEDADGSTVRPAGLEHVDGPAHTARLEVDEAVDVAAERISEKSAGADEAQFLAFVEQQDDRTPERLVSENGPDFEQRRNADAVVGRSRSDRRAVVMRVEQDRVTGPGTNRGDHVA